MWNIHQGGGYYLNDLNTPLPPGYTPYGGPLPRIPPPYRVSEGQKGGIIPFAVFVQKNSRKKFLENFH